LELGERHHVVEPAESADAKAIPRASTAGAASRAFESLAIPNFRYLLSGTAASSFAMWMEQIGQGWLVAQLTDSALQLGLIYFIRGISIIFVSPFVGGFSDRVNRRLLAGAAAAVNGLGALAIALLIVTNRIEIWQLYITAFTGGFSSSIYTPVRQFLVFDIVEERERLPNAIALNSMVNNMARVVGPGIAGFIIGFNVSSAFFSETFFFLCAIASLAAMRLDQQVLLEQEPVLTAVRRGAAYLLEHRTLLRLTMLQAILTMLVFPYLYLMPLMAKNYLHVGSAGYGWLMTGVGIGAFFSGLVVARFADTRRKGLIESVALVVYVSMILAFSFSRIYLLSLVLLMIGGIGFLAFTAYNQTLVQLHVEDEYRGRVLSLYTMSQGLNPFGALMMGFVAQKYLGTPHTIAVFALAALVLSLFAGLASRDVRSL
jgi:MFS family permease